MSDEISDASIGLRESKIKESIKASVSSCMADWLQMRPIDEQADINDANFVVILIDERLSDFTQPYVDNVEKKQPRVIALLPGEMSRREVESTLSKSIRAFEVVSAPFGPRKMARAVAACERTTRTWSQSRCSPIPSDVAPLRQVAADMAIGPVLLQAEGLSQDTTNHNETTMSDPCGASSPPLASGPQALTTGHGSSSSETIITPRSMINEPQNPSGLPGEPHEASLTKEPDSRPKKLRVLLVDDNLINLRFLETYIKKRRPNLEYDCAEDGLQAVEAAENYEAGYSLVFMDLSMPVMDGLEATRKIRALEKDRSKCLGSAAPAPALIVALTGLASGRDQANAFSSGVDLFMTKPVKFKEIGRLLDERAKE
jgi:CheY-like chemotaxis protein